MKTETLSGKVVGCMTTFPARFGLIKPVIESVAPQLDRFFIYVNETTSGFPDISEIENVIVLDGRDHLGDLSARGEMFPLRFINDCVVFTLDDDFIFPRDYVEKHLEILRAFNGRCAVTTHGSIFPDTVDWYYERTAFFVSRRAVNSLQLCSLAGSGTFAFDQRVFSPDPEEFMEQTMVDLKLSLLAAESGLPIWVVPRSENWLRFLETDGLFQEFGVGGLTNHTYHARDVDFSFSKYRNIALAAIDQEGVDIERLGLDPELKHGLQTGERPSCWREAVRTFRSRNNYYRILLGEG